MAKKRASQKPAAKKQIESYAHTDKQRVNNPPVGLVTPQTDPVVPAKKTYQYDPHLDPQLVWAGKAERTSFEIPTVSLHVHERIDPKTIIAAVRTNGDRAKPGQPKAKRQGLLFEEPQENPPLRDALDFYKHPHGWTNRLIAGDSLLVMNSLLEKEGLAGKVQMIYIDPPYGIRYGSNFQPFVNRRDVKDGKDEDLTQEPETLKAFRDTWELGIHSYLTYLRDRLLLARELLHESGSVFVQISDENLHRIRDLLDEVFSPENFIAVVSFNKNSGLASNLLPSANDFILWYARDRAKVKYHQLYESKGDAGGLGRYNSIELADGSRRAATRDERAGTLAVGARLFTLSDLTKPGPGRKYDVTFEGKTFNSGSRWWGHTPEGMEKLIQARRVTQTGKSVSFVRYLNDFPAFSINNVWTDIGGIMSRSDPKVYVVQTSTAAIARCLLMTTDPGDLVFDPTCGSGTTAFVAEQWGRRWITCDTSRVAVTLAKQRLMTGVFEYYKLAHPQEGIGSGFVYKTVPHVTLKSIANNPEIKEGMSRKQIDAAIAKYADQETLYDQPEPDKTKARVTGPFTVEAVPAVNVRGIDEVPRPHPDPLPRGEGGRRPAPLPEGEGGLLPSPSGRGAGGEGPSIKPPLDPDLLAFARKLRKEQTEGESLLWELLRDRKLFGAKFRRQHPVDPYVLDFYCHDARLGIELDGGQHNTDQARSHDAKRSALLAEQGIEVIRFWNNEVLEETEAVLEGIWKGLFDRGAKVPSPYAAVTTLTPGPSPGGRGGMTADTSIARSGATSRQDEWRDELARTGVRGKGGAKIEFARLEPLPGARFLHAVGETNDKQPKTVAVSFGPEHAPLEQRQVEQAWEEARGLTPKPDILLFAAFHFDPEAAKDIDELNPQKTGMQFLKLQMNIDLLTDDLKKKRASNESFWLIGQPDVELRKIKQGEDKGLLQVELHGFDYYNPANGKVESGDTSKIAMWLLDTDYDGRSLYPRQVFFPLSGDKDGWSRLAKNLKAEIDEELIEAYRGTESLAFAAGAHKRVAVKIVDDRGIESLKVLAIE